MKKLLVFLVLITSASFLHAGEYKEGVHYKKLQKVTAASSDKVEVLEFFWYGCPHCYSFEPHVQAWKKALPENVTFARVPAIFRPDWEIQARTYYALKNMGVIETVHGKIFDAVHKKKKRLNTLDAMTTFLEKSGVDKAKFLEEYKSFGVDGFVRKAKKKQSEYKIQGVPGIVINGQYLVSGSMAGSYDNMIKIMDHLIAMESKVVK